MSDFSENIVNQRFRNVYEELHKRGLVRNKSELGEKLGTYNHVINSILRGNRNITLNQLQRLLEEFPIDANYLFGRTDTMFLDEPGVPTRSFEERSFGPRANITLVPATAQGGYALEPQNPHLLEEFPRFSLPHMQGELLAFEVEGDSMHPTITDGDIVVCEPLERGAPIRENHVYVLVTDAVMVKRVVPIKRGSQVTGLRLVSDNPVFQPFEIGVEELRQILQVKCRLTTHAVA